MKEDNELFYNGGENLREIVKRFEAMVKSNRIAYFDVHEYEQMVDHYIQQNRSEDAINVLRIARKQHPNSSELTLKKAEIELFSGHLSVALEDLTSVEAVEKNNPDFYFVKAKAHLVSGEMEQAIRMFDLSIEKSSDQKLEMLFEVVAVLEEFNEFDRALGYLQKGLKIDPANSQIFGELGFIFEKLNRTEEAIDAYVNMLDADPFLPFGWANLGNLYAKLGKNEPAIESFDYAIALEPDGAMTYFSKANTLANMGEFEEALEIFFEYLELEGGDSSIAFCCIGECYEKLGDFENAAEYYRKTLEVEPENPDALYGIAVVELENDNIDESYKYATRAIELDPNIPEYWFGLGKLSMRLDKMQDAKNAFERAISLDPLDFESWLLLSEIEVDNEIEQGIEIIKRALVENGDVAALHYRLGAYYYMQDSIATSLEEFEKGLVLDKSTADEFFEICPDAVNDKKFIALLKKHLSDED